MNRRQIKKEIKKLESIESQLLIMLATYRLSDDEAHLVVSEFLNAVNYRSRFIEALEKLDKEDK